MGKPTPIEPVPLEGLPFELPDLCMALKWAAMRPKVRLFVAMDHRYVPEALEIYSAETKSPRWCIWRDYEGHIHLDDWVKSQFDLPYRTLETALDFIDANL